jgi:hypothetical protein
MSETSSPEPSQVLTKEQKDRAIETLKQIMPSVIKKPAPKNPIPKQRQLSKKDLEDAGQDAMFSQGKERIAA